MTYCIDFFRKFKKEGNFCGLDKSQVSRLMAYLEIVEALVKQKIPEEQIYENFPVGAAIPLISAKGEAHTDGMNYVTAALKDGKKITGKDLQKSCKFTTISGGSATVKPKKKEPYNGTPQRPPLPVEKPAVKESLTTPPPAPIAQTLKEKYGGTLHTPPVITPEDITDTIGQVSPPTDIPTKAPCLSGQPCPDASERSYIKTEVQRGKVCELWNLPLNQLPSEECPILLRQKKAQEGGFVPAGDIDSITGGRIVRGPPIKILREPQVIHFTPTPKQWEFIERMVKSGEFETSDEVVSAALDTAMLQEGGA
jgi:hypothetical protein